MHQTPHNLCAIKVPRELSINIPLRYPALVCWWGLGFFVCVSRDYIEIKSIIKKRKEKKKLAKHVTDIVIGKHQAGHGYE